MSLETLLLSSTRDLVDISRLADGTAEALEELLDRGLEWLGRLAPYDLAVVFELEGGELKVCAARGAHVRPEVRQHRIQLEDFPAIRHAIEERRCRVFTADDHLHEGDLFDGVMDFPHGHACMVVPLSNGVEVFGVMSLDRAECLAYPRAVVDLCEVFGRLLALSISCMRLSQKLARTGIESEERAAALTRHLDETREPFGILFDSKNARVRDLSKQALLVAQTSSTVLLVGETGTGKERLARLIHDKSARKKRPFIPVNTAALPTGTVESELFGHERGAFSGAVRSRPGLFRAADGGTLFLDEIGELPLDLQGKLLRVLQEGEVLPVGSEKSVAVDVRVIAATHVDLEEAVSAGRFRRDLYYRLSVYPLRLLPLRERMEDLPRLCEVLLHENRLRVGKTGLVLSEKALDALAMLDYPGNIRELSNLLERGAIRATSLVVTEENLGLANVVGRGKATDRAIESLVSLAENERYHIERVLRVTNGRIYGEGGAAAILGLPPTTLQSRMKRLGLRY